MSALATLLLTLAVATGSVADTPQLRKPFDLQFADPGHPAFAEGWTVDVAAGVEPGAPVVLESDAAAKQLRVRPARADEAAGRWVFEWEGETAKFYALPDAARLQALKQQNDIDFAAPGGADYEMDVGRRLMTQAQAARRCAPPSGSVAPVRLFLRFDADGRLVESLASPPGRVARCILDIAATQPYAKPPGPFVAILSLRIEP
jgi:hypothetical protein